MGRIVSYEKHIAQLPSDAVLWRFLDVKKLLRLLSDSSIYFCQLKRFSDVLEGDISRHPGFVPPGTDFYHYWHEHKDDPNLWRSRCGASCWHHNSKLSIRMWREYAGLQGAAIQTTVGKLKGATLLHPEHGILVSGAVCYSDDLPVPPGSNAVSAELTMFYKSPKYSYEQEYRLLLDGDIHVMNEYGGVNIPVDLHKTITAIYLPPVRPLFERILIDKLIEIAGVGDLVQPICFS